MTESLPRHKSKRPLGLFLLGRGVSDSTSLTLETQSPIELDYERSEIISQLGTEVVDFESLLTEAGYSLDSKLS